MNRFFLSPQADQDIDEILEYLDGLPLEPGNRILDAIQATILSIAAQPYLGSPHSQLTRLIGEEARSRVVGPYRIFYRLRGTGPEIIAVLHSRRDIASILSARFQ